MSISGGFEDASDAGLDVSQLSLKFMVMLPRIWEGNSDKCLAACD